MERVASSIALHHILFNTALRISVSIDSEALITRTWYCRWNEGGRNHEVRWMMKFVFFNERYLCSSTFGPDSWRPDESFRYFQNNMRPSPEKEIDPYLQKLKSKVSILEWREVLNEQFGIKFAQKFQNQTEVMAFSGLQLKNLRFK